MLSDMLHVVCKCVCATMIQFWYVEGIFTVFCCFNSHVLHLQYFKECCVTYRMSFLTVIITE